MLNGNDPKVIEVCNSLSNRVHACMIALASIREQCETILELVEIIKSNGGKKP